jgi:hypothetical protein
VFQLYLCSAAAAMRVSNESGVQRFVLWWLVERRWGWVEEGFAHFRGGDGEVRRNGKRGEERLLEWCERLLR